MLEIKGLLTGETISDHFLGPEEERTPEGTSVTGEAWRSRIEPGVSRGLKQLERERVVRYEDVHMKPGCERGRPSRLYARWGGPPLSLEVRRQFFSVSLLIVALARADFRVESYDAALGVLRMRHKWDTSEPPLVALIDDQLVAVE